MEMYNSIFFTSSIDKQLLKTQMEIAKIEFHENFSYNKLKSVISFITLSKYPLFYKLLQFSLTISTGSVKSERSISALRRVLNYNRTTMGLNRLGQMSLLAIESNILESITNTDV